MKKKACLSLSRLTHSLRHIRDPRRRSGNYRHQLVDILVIALLAVIYVDARRGRKFKIMGG